MGISIEQKTNETQIEKETQESEHFYTFRSVHKSEKKEKKDPKGKKNLATKQSSTKKSMKS